MLSGILAIVLFKADISLALVYEFMGVVISPAVLPIVFSLTWQTCAAAGAVAGSLGGLFSGIVAWILVTISNYDEVNLDNLSQDWPLFAGNLTSFVASAVICIGVSLVWPQHTFAWSDLKVVYQLEEEDASMVEEDDPETMQKATKFTIRFGVAVTVVLLGWPIFMIPAQVFSLGYF